MAGNNPSPDFLDLLDCLDPVVDESLSLCARLELTFFGSYVSNREDAAPDGELSGFLSSSGTGSSGASGANDTADTSTAFQPSHFTWRNTVSNSSSTLF